MALPKARQDRKQHGPRILEVDSEHMNMHAEANSGEKKRFSLELGINIFNNL